MNEENEIIDITPNDKQDVKDVIMGENKNPISIIIAPHADDEVIGCFEILESGKPIIILYTDDIDHERKKECLELRKAYENIKAQLFLRTIPQNFLDTKNTYYFPCPSDTHPLHREQSFIGEQLARNGFDVIFYSTEMNVDYKYECRNPVRKKEIMDGYYSRQSDLWKYDHKYFLFSGYMKYVFP